MIHPYLVCWLLMQPAYCAEQPPEMVMADDKSSDAVMLTRPDGSPIWVNPHSIALIRGPLAGEHGNSVIMFTNGAKQSVTETVEEIKQIVHDMDKEGP